MHCAVKAVEPAPAENQRSRHYVVCTASDAIDSLDSVRTINIRVYVSPLLTQLFHDVEYYATVRTVFAWSA